MQDYAVWGRAVALAFALVLLASCSGSDAVSGPVVEAVDGTVPSVDLSREPMADGQDPAVSAGAASDHLDCRHGTWLGIAALDFGYSQSAADPDQALELFVNDELFALPRSGFVAAGQDQNRRLYTYSADGSVKVSIVVADSAKLALDAPDGWVVEALASCDPAEFDPSIDDRLGWEVWLDAGGNRLPSSVVRTFSGPEHCDWEAATYLWLEDRTYIADPKGVLGDIGAASEFDEDADLPTDATDTGYRRDGREIWLSNDSTVAYVTKDDDIEAWPMATNLPGCA